MSRKIILHEKNTNHTPCKKQILGQAVKLEYMEEQDNSNN